jgi:hypothetical protein
VDREYQPNFNKSEGYRLLWKTISLQDCTNSVHTGSSLHGLQEIHPEMKIESGGTGGIVDEMFEMRKRESESGGRLEET